MKSRTMPTPPRKRVPRVFYHGRLSSRTGFYPSLKDWFERYGWSWSTFWTYVRSLGVPEDHEFSSEIEDRDWHAECEKNRRCHSYLGTDYHYCTPDYRCMEWLKLEREGKLTDKIQLGWAKWYGTYDKNKPSPRS